MPDTLQSFFRRTFNNAKKPTIEDMEPLFYELVEDYSQVFIVIDALDECQALSHGDANELPGYRRRYREETFEFMDRLFSRPSLCAKLLVTSRREEDIQDAFERYPVIQVNATQVNADIETYLRDEIDRRLQKKILKLRDTGLKAEILEKLVIGAQGMCVSLCRRFKQVMTSTDH